jgi:PKHD-type hydroxylase
MNLEYKYWYFQSAISPKICDEIIQYGLSKKTEEQQALTGNIAGRDLNKFPLTDKEIGDLKKKRDSNVTWLDDKWIYNEIHPFVNKANRSAGWNFEWDWSENCQFTKYNKGQYYGWHCDSWEKPYKEEGPLKGKIRKLSVTVSLSDPKDYKGGELEFDFRNKDPDKKPHIVKCKEILPRGSVVVFPSFLWHRVCPVTKGTRYSLVIWNLGYPFK